MSSLCKTAAFTSATSLCSRELAVCSCNVFVCNCVTAVCNWVTAVTSCISDWSVVLTSSCCNCDTDVISWFRSCSVRLLALTQFSLHCDKAVISSLSSWSVRLLLLTSFWCISDGVVISWFSGWLLSLTSFRCSCVTVVCTDVKKVLTIFDKRAFLTDNSLQSADKGQQESRAVAEKPHDAVVKLYTYRNL